MATEDLEEREWISRLTRWLPLDGCLERTENQLDDFQLTEGGVLWVLCPAARAWNNVRTRYLTLLCA